MQHHEQHERQNNATEQLKSVNSADSNIVSSITSPPFTDNRELQKNDEVLRVNHLKIPNLDQAS